MIAACNSQIGGSKNFVQILSMLVEHPQTNGLVEVANKVILIGLKKRLEKAKGL